MKLADCIAAWFGYVPSAALRAVTRECEMLTECLRGECDDCLFVHRMYHDSPTVTTTKPRPTIIVSADFKRGIPCS